MDRRLQQSSAQRVFLAVPMRRVMTTPRSSLDAATFTPGRRSIPCVSRTVKLLDLADIATGAPTHSTNVPKH